MYENNFQSWGIFWRVPFIVDPCQLWVNSTACKDTTYFDSIHACLLEYRFVVA